MIRHFWFVLLLATGFAVAADRPRAQREAGDAKAQAKIEAAQKHAQAQKEKDAKSQTEKVAKAQTDKDAKVQTEKDTQAQLDKNEQALPDKNAQPQTDKDATAQSDEEAKLTSVPGGKALGMSILGNQEAPTSLVIVPWKSSELGASPGISPMLDDSRQPVDKEVFMRALNYYEIRSETKK